MSMRLPGRGPVALESLGLTSTNGDSPPQATDPGLARRSARAATAVVPLGADSVSPIAARTGVAAPPGPRPAPGLRPNRLVWRGRLVSDPELRRSNGGVDYCVLRLAQQILDSQRRAVMQTLDCVLFRERARDAAEVFRRGDLIEACGELRLRQRTTSQGDVRLEATLFPNEELGLIARVEST